ncbi:hypothetical protein [Thauera sinica]|uniref:Uncharacterized protein n=1 Tax=Thauera sinica TaxID=2665146 RepID=A0ABW1ARE4_9RHOO|nr:hypothetical protein [Thauera sp. K11]ATE62120.1 hypothetical protein CCZ27_21005 [Thauera sp. K11]
MDRTWIPADYGLKDKPGIYDTGTGALQLIEANPGFPGIQRVTIRSYCGRHEDDRRFYRLTGDPRRIFATLEEAIAARPVRLT